MTRLLVTGANGFVGRWLVRAAVEAGYDVVASILPGDVVPLEWQQGEFQSALTAMEADLLSADDRGALAASHPDAVVHLAGVASGAQARRDPALADRVNRDATAALAAALAAEASPLLLFVSSAEVYGGGHAEPIGETAPVMPMSPYAVSKAEAEMALRDLATTAGLRLIVARPFPHSGPGQTTDYVLPAFAARLREARQHRRHRVATGNLDIIRDFLDVRDVVQAYLHLLERGTPGESYNIASGTGHSLRDCFTQLAVIVGIDAEPVPDDDLMRPSDVAVLIGDATRLAAQTGWRPLITFEQTLRDVVNAQAN